MKQDPYGRWISEVEPIEDEMLRKKLAAWLREAHMVQQVVWEGHVI